MDGDIKDALECAMWTIERLQAKIKPGAFQSEPIDGLAILASKQLIRRHLKELGSDYQS